MRTILSIAGILSLTILAVLFAGYPTSAEPNANVVKPPVTTVLSTVDFEVTGRGEAKSWQKAEWVVLNRRGAKGHNYSTKVKMLYSEKGMYFLFACEDRELSATITKDFEDLWEEDVVEFFLWPDEKRSLYFEYELSPLGKELPLFIPNLNGDHWGWIPWHYEGERRTRKAISILEGKQESGAKCKGWQAEIFVPYTLLSPLQNVPPKPGTKWRANFYRVDYDNKLATGWDWARVGPSYHEYQKFGTLIFGK